MNEKLIRRVKRLHAVVVDAFERALEGLESLGEGVEMLPYVERQLRICRESVDMAIALVQQQGEAVAHE